VADDNAKETSSPSSLQSSRLLSRITYSAYLSATMCLEAAAASRRHMYVAGLPQPRPRTAKEQAASVSGCCFKFPSSRLFSLVPQHLLEAHKSSRTENHSICLGGGILSRLPGKTSVVGGPAERAKLFRVGGSSEADDSHAAQHHHSQGCSFSTSSCAAPYP